VKSFQVIACWISLAAFCIYAESAGAQNTDSSFSALMRSGKPDSIKVSSIEKLIDAYFDAGEYEKAIACAKQGIILTSGSRGQKSKGLFLHKIGVAYYNLSDFQQALMYYQQALSLRQQIGDSLGMAKTLGNIGNTYNELANYAKAMDMELRSIKICEKIGAHDVLKNILSSLGDVYRNTGEFRKSLEYHRRSLEMEEKANNKDGIGQSLGNIGQVYFQLDRLDTALQYQERSLKIAGEVDDKFAMSNALKAIGEIYQKQKNYDKAFDYQRNYLRISKEIDDQIGVLNANLSIGILYFLTNKFQEAEKISKEAIKISQELGPIEYEKEAYSNLKDIYDSLHKPLLAYDAFKKFIKLKDSIDSEESQKELVKHEMSFEFEKKESQMIAEEERRAAASAAESKRQKLIIYGVSFGLFLVMVLAVIVYRNLQNNKRKNKIIEAQKAEVEQKNHVIEHKQKEIVDSITYAQRIQHALLASEAILTENLPSYFVYFKPKDIVSGDFYWATHSHNKFYLVTADSTGHGVPGAFMSLLNISFLNEAVNEKHFDKPNEILNHTRTRLISSLKADGSEEGGKDGMDCVLTAFDFKSNTLEYAAANNSFYIIRNNEVITHPADKMPVGKSPRDHEPFTLRTVQLEKGDTVYLLTDGFPDQFGGPKGKKFMYKQLERLLLANCHLSMNEQKTALDDNLMSWMGSLEQVDDVLLIGVKVI
jgi:tetratricopeptide (TPR) repeat protein